MNAPQPAFIDQVLTSAIPGEVAKRFLFTTGLVGALCTLKKDLVTGELRPVLLVVSTHPPSQQVGYHDFGIDYATIPVATAEEARQLLAQFGQQEAAEFRAGCRPVS